MVALNDVTESLPLRRAYIFLESNGLQTEAETIRSSKAHLGSYTTTLKRAMIIALLRRRNLLKKFVDENWPFGTTEKGRRLIERYARIYDRFEESEGSANGEEPEDAGLEETSFAYEQDLRDYLAENLHLLESDLALWSTNSDTDAVEFAVDDSGRRIDILAKDHTGTPVVLELKVSRGHERTIGQSLYYRARVKELFKADRVRIVIIARQISPELRAVAHDLTDVTLFEYRLSMSVQQV